MAAEIQDHVTAAHVGDYFLRQYYEILRQQPEVVHQFYKEESTLSCIDGPVVRTAKATLQIHSLTMSMGHTEIEIQTTHSVGSLNGGILVMVLGSVQSRKFARTFFLAPQKKGFFVLNDILLFLDEEQLPQHSMTSESFLNEKKICQHLSILGKYDPNLNRSNLPPEPVVHSKMDGRSESSKLLSPMRTEETKAVDKYSMSETLMQMHEIDNGVQKEIHLKENSAAYPSSVSTMQICPPVVEEPATIKHTYASIVRMSKGPVKSSACQFPLASSVPVASEWDGTAEPALAQTHSVHPVVPKKSLIEAVEDGFTVEDKGELSVYVRNIPSSATVSQLEEEFKKFGRIKSDGIQIKGRKDSDDFYAFVEFEDIIGVENAIKVSQVLLNGHLIHIEARRPRRFPFRGRRGRGRAGYPLESSRDHLNGRGFGRAKGRASGRGYNVSGPRGNGYHQRGGPREEKGVQCTPSAMKGQLA